MQNHVRTPAGLSTGSGPQYNSKGRLVTCLGVFCDDEPTHVQEHVTFNDELIKWGAYCEACATKHILPDDEVNAIHERATKFGTQPQHCLPASSWFARPFNDEEQAEIDAIKRGELVETYKSPGKFAWEPPNTD
ncbi:hypothetical protein [Kitasatospora sp. NPDC098663]|uniref:hypothetical protein n=1 Tax=Kitasatospora sp. NPDC098663 TaxID=3364096 RepID=UPI00380D280C